MLLEIDKTALLGAIKDQDLSNSDCQTLSYNREQLAEAALGIVKDGFAALDLRNIQIKDNIALCVRSTPHLVVLRCLNQTIRQAIGIHASDRDTINHVEATKPNIIRRLHSFIRAGASSHTLDA